MSFIKNPEKVIRGIDAEIHRIRDVHMAHWRDIVWVTFCRILENSPQFTGKAVANWRIGVGSPDHTFDPTLGDHEYVLLFRGNEFKGRGKKRRVATHVKGDQKWIEVAKRINAPKMLEITATHARYAHVYFSNMTKGDNDGGKSSVFYMTSLQKPGYWMKKLRGFNKPYEVAAESVAAVRMLYPASKGMERIPGGNEWTKYVGAERLTRIKV